jgi:hypothetical protein
LDQRLLELVMLGSAVLFARRVSKLLHRGCGGLGHCFSNPAGSVNRQNHHADSNSEPDQSLEGEEEQSCQTDLLEPIAQMPLLVSVRPRIQKDRYSRILVGERKLTARADLRQERREAVHCAIRGFLVQ